MITAKKYLLDIGLDEAHLPELFNDDDKSHYQITELMESYHQAKTKDLQEQVTLVTKISIVGNVIVKGSVDFFRIK